MFGPIPSLREVSSTPLSQKEQLELYARDLRRTLNEEHARSNALAASNDQLLIYAKELKQLVAAERSRSAELERAYFDSLQRLNQAVRYKDNETANHAVRLSHYCRMVALQLNWSHERAEQLFHAAPMHDVGKIGVPDAILQKAGPLTEAEWPVLRQHTLIGAQLLAGSGSSLLELGGELALSHHENWDGSGYPHGLAGDAIPEAAAIVHLVDVYDALRSARPYKVGFPHIKSLRILQFGDGRTMPMHFQPRVLSALAAVHEALDEVYERHSN